MKNSALDHILLAIAELAPEQQTADLGQLETGGAINADLCDLRNIEKETE